MDKTVLRDKMSEVNTHSDSLRVIVAGIIGDRMAQLDNCMSVISESLSQEKDLTDYELDKILLRLPLYVYNISEFVQELEIRCGVASATQNEDEANATLNSTGTVVEKKAKSDLAGIESGLVVSAYKSALTLVKSKISAAFELLASAKKVQTRRMEELRNTATLKGVE